VRPAPGNSGCPREVRHGDQGGIACRSGRPGAITADLCRDDPGHELDVIVESTVRALTEIWTGDSDSKTEIAAGRLLVTWGGRGGSKLWRWLGRSMFAPSAESRPAR